MTDTPGKEPNDDIETVIIAVTITVIVIVILGIVGCVICCIVCLSRKKQSQVTQPSVDSAVPGYDPPPPRPPPLISSPPSHDPPSPSSVQEGTKKFPANSNIY